MLHSESWFSCPKVFRQLASAFCLTLLTTGCSEHGVNTNAGLSLDAFGDLRSEALTVDEMELRGLLEVACTTDEHPFEGDRRAMAYYMGGGRLLWIDRMGVSGEADTLLKIINDVGAMGFAPNAFYADTIANDLRRAREAHFDSADNRAVRVMARLEYNLTRAFLRYALGQRFGFTDPHLLFNRIDTAEGSYKRATPIYKKLYAIDTERPDNQVVNELLGSIGRKSVGPLLRSMEPTDTLYLRLQRELAKGASGDTLGKLLCNMERLRWRKRRPVLGDDVQTKHVLVNVAAFHLYASGGDSLLDMRIGCGTRKHKTPLLQSHIERMDVNPVWNIPYSILKNEVAPHARDTNYFARNRYYIIHRATGERASVADVTAAMLRSGDYRVAQEGGEGNSLGRIIFRFPNEFSVFLHDTSSRSVFSRSVRSVSHGCVRVQKPFDLAVFLLGDTDEWTLDKLRISMGMKPETDRGRRVVAESEGELRLVRSLLVQPHVALTIDYYTAFTDERGRLQYYNDVYGYDGAIWSEIKPLTIGSVKSTGDESR